MVVLLYCQAGLSNLNGFKTFFSLSNLNRPLLKEPIQILPAISSLMVVALRFATSGIFTGFKLGILSLA